MSSQAKYIDRFRGGDNSPATAGSLMSEGASKRIIPGPPPVDDKHEESLDVWGFRDTIFRINSRGNVELTGTRYNFSGVEMPNLLPWISGVMDVDIRPEVTNPSSYPPAIPEAVANPEFLDEVREFLEEDQITDDAQLRLRRGHGHTQWEMYNIKYGALARVPDLIIYPSDEEQVSAIVRAALQHDVCLIPYGGGTNVTEALLCPTDEERTIVSVDMSRMNRILWIDPTNRMAHIEAGAVGRHIMEQLESYGLTMGHEPDSIEFSTLGGWIATYASGMKKNRYGNIEDLVLDVNVVTAQGMLTRSSVAPRESIGADPRRLVFGSEGNLGIITSAVVKLFPVPEVQRYGSVLFPSFEDGISFMYELTQRGVPPASIRLVDNLQFQFSIALKPRPEGWKALKSKLEKWYVMRLRGFDPERMVACTFVFEGNRSEVKVQEKSVYSIASRHGGMKAGSENGERGYQLTFGIAYIRDFIMNHYILGESFETSVSWSKALSLCDNVNRRIWEEHRKRNLPGNPYVSARVTQVYETGVCIYFYLAFYYKGVENPSEVYAEIERAARDEILRSGGSLSHHHGVGKLRQHFLPDIMSPAALKWIRQTKLAIDPNNVFGSGNQLVNAQADISHDSPGEVRIPQKES